MPTNNLFLYDRHDHYQRQAKKWEMVEDVYNEHGVERYLSKKLQTETKDEFGERSRIAPYHNIFANVIDSHASTLFQKEPERDFGSLGDVTDRGSTAYKLYRDADGMGTNYNVQIRKAANQLFLKNEVWCMVDGINQRGLPEVKVVPPEAVVNWNYDETQVLVKREKPGVADIFDPGIDDEAEFYTAFTPEGYQNFKLTDREKDGYKDPQIQTEGFQNWRNPYVTVSGKKVPPIFRIQLPFQRYVAWNLARNAIAIYEEDTVHYMQFRKSGFPKLVLALEDASDEDERSPFEKATQSLKAGSNVLSVSPDSRNSHKYISPPSESAEMMHQDIQDRIRLFYRTANRKFESTSKTYETATAVQEEGRQNQSAYLSTVAHSLEELENRVLFLISQLMFPNDPSRWDTNVSYDKSYSMESIRIEQGTPEDFNEETNTNEQTE